MILSDANVGDEVFVKDPAFYKDVRGIVLGTRFDGKEVCLGFKEHNGFYPWELRLDTVKTFSRSPNNSKWINNVENFFHEYNFAYFISARTPCLIIKPVIKSPGLFCFECKLSAEHATPNTDDNKFVCNSCTFLKSL